MIDIPPRLAYLFLSVVLLGVWTVLLVRNRRGRRWQVIASLALAGAGPLGELLYIPDYWHPGTIWSYSIGRSYISLEDLIFAFSIMGIMAALPPLLLKREASSSSTLSVTDALVRIAAALACVLGFSLLLWSFGMISIYATALAMALVTVALLLQIRDRTLVRVAGVGALGMVLLMFTVYTIGFALVSDTESILRATWSLYSTPLGIRILRVPLAEIIWACTFGGLFSLLLWRFAPRRPSTGQ